MRGFGVRRSLPGGPVESIVLQSRPGSAVQHIPAGLPLNPANSSNFRGFRYSILYIIYLMRSCGLGETGVWIHGSGCFRRPNRSGSRDESSLDAGMAPRRPDVRHRAFPAAIQPTKPSGCPDLRPSGGLDAIRTRLDEARSTGFRDFRENPHLLRPIRIQRFAYPSVKHGLVTFIVPAWRPPDNRPGASIRICTVRMLCISAAGTRRFSGAESSPSPTRPAGPHP